MEKFANNQTLRSAAAFRELCSSELTRRRAAEEARPEPGASSVATVCALAVAPELRDDTTDRPYRPAGSAAPRLRELSAGAGTKVDPQVVPAFVELLGGLRRETP